VECQENRQPLEKKLQFVVMAGMKQRIGDVDLWVEEQGAGPAVLCISGLGYSNWCWRETVAALKDRYRVISFDNRGAGRSDAPDGEYSIAQFADDAAGVLVNLNAAPAHVIGHSMGGYIAVTLAVQHPSLVRSLVLIGTSGGGVGSLPVPAATSDAWKAAVKLPPREFAAATMPYSFATGWSDAHPGRFKQLLAQRVEFPTATEAWKKQFRAASEFGRQGLPQVGQIDVPALVVHGTDDRVVPYVNGERLAGQLQHARLETFDRSGHLCFLEEPSRAHLLFDSWLQS
jgi:pimeloyl-ACP methyl ester carboxylesterase